MEISNRLRGGLKFFLCLSLGSIIQQPISEQHFLDQQSNIIPLISEFPYTTEQSSKVMKLLEYLSERKDDEQVYPILITTTKRSRYSSNRIKSTE